MPGVGRWPSIGCGRYYPPGILRGRRLGIVLIYKYFSLYAMSRRVTSVPQLPLSFPARSLKTTGKNYCQIYCKPAIMLSSCE